MYREVHFALVAALLGAALPAAGSNPLPVLSIWLRFDFPCPQRVIDAMEAETEEALLPANIQVAWETGEPKLDGTSFADLIVIKLRGQCQEASGEYSVAVLPYHDVDGLGATETVENAIQPFAEVRCDRLIKMLEPELRGVSPELRNEVLGRGLGRILAHELRHMLLKRRDHAASGIGKGIYTVHDLMAPEFRFDQQDVSALHRGWELKLGVNLARESPAARPSPVSGGRPAADTPAPETGSASDGDSQSGLGDQ